MARTMAAGMGSARASIFFRTNWAVAGRPSTTTATAASTRRDALRAKATRAITVKIHSKGPPCSTR